MDPRLTPANEVVACSSLNGQIQHTNFVEGKNYQVEKEIGSSSTVQK